MFQFCFNDCIPKNETDDGLVSHLSSTLSHYNSIKKQFPSYVDGIVTDRIPSELFLNDSHFTLGSCIKQLSRETQKIAFSNFLKYPVEKFMPPEDIDSLIEKEYTITINEKPIDALNAKMVSENEGVLFTLPVHPDLKKDALLIVDKEKQTYKVLNQFGEDKNTAFLSGIIKADIIKKVGGFEKLIAIVGECSYDNRFKLNFENITSETQDKLLKEISRAIDRKSDTRFHPDGELIKNVTPPKEKEINVFELRIHSPVAIRMYFYETSNKIYLGSIERKPKDKVQDTHIHNAVSIIKELIGMESQQA